MILLVGHDPRFLDDFRSCANAAGFLVVRAEPSAGIAAILLATRPVAVLLDLDWPDLSAWKVAEHLLDQPACPAVILLTERATRFTLKTVIRAGSLVDKSEPPSRLLKRVEQVLAAPEISQAERNAAQRALIGWLRPSQWAESTCPSHRHWGINE